MFTTACGRGGRDRSWWGSGRWLDGLRPGRPAQPAELIGGSRPCREARTGSAHQMKRRERRGLRHQETTFMTVQRLEHIGIVVDDLAAATAFFTALGLEVEGEASVEGSLVDRINGLEGVRADITILRTPDGNAKV